MKTASLSALAIAACLAASGCAAPSLPSQDEIAQVYQRRDASFVYPVSDTQAYAECKAEALRDFHNSRDHSIFDALDIQSPIRRCMEGKGYAVK